MGRTAAIIGPTPSFVRWAIELDCPLRELKSDRLPDTTYRQLRGIREWSRANRENRCIDEVCLHPQSSQSSGESTLGFFVEEIAAPFGGLGFISSCCSSCPANVDDQALQSTFPRAAQVNDCAGCFGWISNDPRFQLDRVSRGLKLTEPRIQESAVNLNEQIEHLASDRVWSHQLNACFPTANHIWHRIWREPLPNQNQLQVIRQILVDLLDIADSADKFPRDDLRQLINAISLCLERSLSLHLDFVPAGFSDGNRWQIRPHCPECKFDRTEHPPMKNCSMCGSESQLVVGRTSKVLGIRPYLDLVQILGTLETTKLVDRFEGMR